MSLKIVQISLILSGNFFQKISGPSSSDPSRTFRRQKKSEGHRTASHGRRTPFDVRPLPPDGRRLQVADDAVRWAWDFLKKLPKSINEIWTFFKLINKLPKNYNKNTNCTASRCIWYWNCNFWVTCWWVWKLSKFHWYFLAIFSKNLRPHLAWPHLTFSEYRKEPSYF